MLFIRPTVYLLGTRLLSSDGQSGRLVSGRSSVRSRQEARSTDRTSYNALYRQASVCVEILPLSKLSRGLPPPTIGFWDRTERPPTSSLRYKGAGTSPSLPPPFFLLSFSMHRHHAAKDRHRSGPHRHTELWENGQVWRRSTMTTPTNRYNAAVVIRQREECRHGQTMDAETIHDDAPYPSGRLRSRRGDRLHRHLRPDLPQIDCTGHQWRDHHGHHLRHDRRQAAQGPGRGRQDPRSDHHHIRKPPAQP